MRIFRSALMPLTVELAPDRMLRAGQRTDASTFGITNSKARLTPLSIHKTKMPSGPRWPAKNKPVSV